MCIEKELLLVDMSAKTITTVNEVAVPFDRFESINDASSMDEINEVFTSAGYAVIFEF